MLAWPVRSRRCAVFLAHGEQRAHAAFIAGAARLDALADPHFFLGQALVEQLIGAGFIRQLRRFLRGVVAVVAGPAGEVAAIQVNDARGHAIDEAAVVADEQQRRRGIRAAGFPATRWWGCPGGWWVHPAAAVPAATASARASKRAAAPAAGEILVARFAVETQLRQHRGHARGDLPAFEQRIGGEPGGDHFFHRRFRHRDDVLLQHRQPRAGPQPDLAGVRQLCAGDQPQQRALAFAVAPDDADALAGLHLQRNLLQQRARTEGERDVVEAQDGRHGVKVPVRQ